MKKIIAVLLLLCLCVTLVACKSKEAKKADELILAIGEVTVDSEAAINAAQTYYDSLPDEQKAEVEHYDTLVAAHELLQERKLEAIHQEIMSLIEQGDYIGASDIVYQHPEFADYDELVQLCGSGVAAQLVKTKGEEKEPGKYFLELVGNNITTISAWYMEETNALQFVYYSAGYGIGYGITMDYTMGSDQMLFMRTTTNMSKVVNTQYGTIAISDYRGNFLGNNVDNSDEVLLIPGLSVTSFTTTYEKQTRGYHIATMSFINEVLDALYEGVTEIGYTGSIHDMGFTSYKVAPSTKTSTEEPVVNADICEQVKAFVQKNGTPSGTSNTPKYVHETQKAPTSLNILYDEEEGRIWVQSLHMQRFNEYYQVDLYICAADNTISFRTQHATLDSSHESGIRIIMGTGTLDLQNMTALTPVTFTELTDNTGKEIPQGYTIAFQNRINSTLAALEEFLIQNNLGSLRELGFAAYEPPMQVGTSTFSLS